MNFDKLLKKDFSRFKPAVLKLKKNSKILVTGAGGSIGSEISKQILAINPKILILLDSSEFALFNIYTDLQKIKNYKKSKTKIIPLLINLCDHELIKIQLENYELDYIFHSAAYKHVNLLQENSLSGLKNNVIGLENLLKITSTTNKNFIHISTDKAVRPVNVMGLSKKLCEILIKQYSKTEPRCKYNIVRFGNVLNSSGSVIPIFQRQINLGENVTVTDKNASRYFMTIPEAVSLVISASSLRLNGEIYVLDMGEPVKILDLANYMIKTAGFVPTDKKNPKKGEIKIDFIGIRNGEKITEDLSTGILHKTSINGVLRANEKAEDFKNLNKILKLLKSKNLCNSDLEIIQNLAGYEKS